ncbi:TetR/AcrR family transcriptional regulator [Microbacterium stercoris]|uniref:TetR/AcrR family transcriptional regulator n=1 Tax=Microbacterium stercoris TaxID=2820289 RepID=A0A939QUF2_9MICO|nr:TetR/AcrR family transcriptional regulator [Microbacterium stercoris]MBO3664871.1 TetR/AcrR family transcriptional regulator [Microbacterium stercoris]
MSPAPGRPRLTPGRPGLGPREEVLAAAAALFVEQGFAATSTRQIAERAGLRQASLYYHFAGKDEMLLELLEESVRPTLERAREHLEAENAALALCRFVLADVDILLRDPHNIGVLYLSPEVTGAAFASFRAHREELVAVYGALAARVGPAVDAAFAGRCCIQLVEMVIAMRREDRVPERVGERIARACLRTVGVDDDRIAAIIATAGA